MGDLRKGITLIGKAAKAIGGDNWGRRFVFEEGKVVVSLGYSIVIEKDPLTLGQLDQSVSSIPSIPLKRRSSSLRTDAIGTHLVGIRNLPPYTTRPGGGRRETNVLHHRRTNVVRGRDR